MKLTLARLCCSILISLSTSAFANAKDASVTTASIGEHPFVTQRAHPPATTDWQKEVKEQCATSQVQFHKLEGYKNCIAEKQVNYASGEWCPVVKAFCDAQWYPFGGKAQCFTERGCAPPQ